MGPDRLSILVDENVPYALETFGLLGTVRALPGRRISAADVKDVDALIVRSVTRVNELLLSGSKVKFVGTATIGWDHIDVGYLRGAGIAFASAPGSNANSVAEYIVAALLESSQARQKSLEGSTMAVIGVGSVGSRVVEKAQALGMRCVLNDPPRKRAAPDAAFVSLDEALPRADYVTLHVPLEHSGPDATAGMADRGFFERLQRGAVFLNTSRGGVVDETALAHAVDSRRISHAILDVFEREPDIDPEIVRRAFIATPHIAGYSFDGKVKATMMLFDALCGWLEGTSLHETRCPSSPELSRLLPPPAVPRIELPGAAAGDEALLRAVVSAVYDIREDDRALREAMSQTTPGARFDLLRKSYQRRREFHHTTVALRAERDALIRKVARLGFRVETT